MLALKSYEQENGFSVMTADELYYINGGSGATISNSTTGNGAPSSNAGFIVALTVATLVTGDNPPSHTEAVAHGIYQSFGGKYNTGSSSSGSSGSSSGSKSK